MHEVSSRIYGEFSLFMLSIWFLCLSRFLAIRYVCVKNCIILNCIQIYVCAQTFFFARYEFIVMNIGIPALLKEMGIIFLKLRWNSHCRHCRHRSTTWILRGSKKEKGKAKTISIYSGWKLTARKKRINQKPDFFPAFVSTFICGQRFFFSLSLSLSWFCY